MKAITTDIMIVGAGPVGLMCAYLASLSGLSVVIADKSSGPITAGRADALNARTLQLFEIAGLFDDIYSKGITCNTISVFEDGIFQSRQNHWWEALEGCFHKHFLMVGQSEVERILDNRVRGTDIPYFRNAEVKTITKDATTVTTTLANDITVQSKYIIGADGSRSIVRESFCIPFNIVKPEITWAALDGKIETDMPMVDEIVVFQSETADVARIPREGDIDRFYVRVDTHDFTLEDVERIINKACAPYTIKVQRLDWMSQFSVRESVAEKLFVNDRVFIAGDAGHIHSFNGGQGLNTGLADAFNLIWKIKMVETHQLPCSLLQTYEDERKRVAESVIETSGKLVRSTKFSSTNTHANDYVDIIEKRSGNMTGMGIRYNGDELIGTRVHDMLLAKGAITLRLYSLLSYDKFTLVTFGNVDNPIDVPAGVQHLKINTDHLSYQTDSHKYNDIQLLVRPDGYIADLSLVS